jgi:regulatory subunit for Cdc7p protein kinase
LKRLVESDTSPGPEPATKRNLAKLLRTEQLYGSTERDPTQRRNDFRYFGKGNKFVLVEDMRQELATIAVYEYANKTRSGTASSNDEAKVPWPVLYCHPNSRSPFIPFDEKEKKRFEKQQQLEEMELAKERRKATKEHSGALPRPLPSNSHVVGGDLRRTVSMNNLHRRANQDCQPDDDHGGEQLDSAQASGYGASTATGYMAASGNSVGITSTTGTTSTAGYASRNGQLPSTLSGRMNKHITTSLKFPSASADKENKVPPMGPPATIPDRVPFLRKSKSTNTLKLPKREENSKPGYCESCRVKFDDFKIVSRCFSSV